MKILVIQLKMIGDVLTSSILFKALREKYPNARLDYLIYEHTKPVIENNPNIDRLILFKPSEHKSLAGLQKLAKEVKKEKYDAVIDVYSKINSAFITLQSSAKIRSSYRKWYTRNAYTHTFPYKKDTETIAGLAIENRLQLLTPMGDDFPKEIKPRIFLRDEEKIWAKDLLKNAEIDRSKRLFMISILGSGPEKTYPGKYMAYLLDYIVEEAEPTLLLNYIPSQKKEVDEILELCKTATRKDIRADIVGKNLREFIAICSQCDALLGNEGGAVNMAKALDIPTFSIFAPQTPRKEWGLYEKSEKNSSVHLEDYFKEILEDKDKKALRKESKNLYLLLKPELFEDELKEFLQKFS
ncbi:glycosyltransferase [Christiangramia fulva]|uniref:Glycosyltransferase n=1 Tax=Christiangramia fulva TaxID=2126553 RepID=A0A2R3Z6B8_9FLAO|nr:glycosyltransferase family 9 protein [Christiangramia fulva]AVR45821.1 glycosyltransferase [Christiangramia fulva]